MSSSGFIVRFVDVVLILLFGFISISTIKQSEIELAKSTEAQRIDLDPEVVIYVAVRSDGGYLVENETELITDTGALRSYLVSVREELGNPPVRVKLRCAFNAPIRFAMAAAKVCDQLDIPKSIEVELQSQSS